MKTLIGICILGVVLLACSCKDGSTATNASSSQTATGQMLLRFADPPAGITSVVAMLSRSGFTTRTMHLSISGSSASGSFDEVQVGTWHLTVDALDSTESVRFSGQTDVDVQPGLTSNVSLQLLPTSGRIEITVTWGGTPQDPSLLLYLPFNGNANDESGWNHNGTVSGATLVPDRLGNANSAYSFDGLYNYIQIPDLIPDTISAFSMSAWAKATNTTGTRMCVYLGARSGEAFLRIKNSHYSMGANLANGILADVYAAPPAANNTFVHIVGVYRRGVGMEIWLNGTLSGQITIPFTRLLSGFSTHDGAIGSYAPAWIDWAREQGTYPWQGVIDQARVYSRALSQTEIIGLYNSGQ